MALTPEEQQEQTALIERILSARTPQEIESVLRQVDGWMERYPEDQEIPGVCEQLVYALDRWKRRQAPGA